MKFRNASWFVWPLRWWRGDANVTSAEADAILLSSSMPAHVAMIMDGNGRWAQTRGLPRIEGHRRGADTVRTMIEYCCELKIQCLTLYCFSNENWKRPAQELDFLMSLLKQYLIQERPMMMRNNVRLKVIGRREGLPADIIHEMDSSLAATAANKGLTLCLAINYGARQELVDAVQAIASSVKSGSLRPESIDESTIQNHLYTQGMPDPDLLIRTSGEMRISNFLLWQISYSELWITPKSWPEFSREDFRDALQHFAKRQRRFGGLDSVV
jgi:undecaprenyl diphosphate synthase